MFPESLLLRLVYLIRYSLPTLVLARMFGRKKAEAPDGKTLRILVTRLDWLGDFLMDTPFLRELRGNYPAAQITLVVSRKVAQLAMACPYVDEVLVLDVLPRMPAFSSGLKYLIAMVKHLRYLVAFSMQHLSGRFDLAIQPRWDADFEAATLVIALSGASRTVAYSENTSIWKVWCNWGFDRLLTDPVPPGSTAHDTDRSLDLIRYLGGVVKSRKPEIWWRREDTEQAKQFLGDNQISHQQLLIAFGIGASSPRRQWPFYGELIHRLSERLEFTPILLSGPGEESNVARIKEVSPSAVVMQSLPLGVVAAVLSRCALFLGNDSGPMHLAAAVGLPVVELSCHPLGGDPDHVNCPDRTGPVSTDRSIIRPKHFLDNCTGGCSMETPHCIAGITPEEVFLTTVQMFGQIPKKSGGREVPTDKRPLNDVTAFPQFVSQRAR